MSTLTQQVGVDWSAYYDVGGEQFRDALIEHYVPPVPGEDRYLELHKRSLLDLLGPETWRVVSHPSVGMFMQCVPDNELCLRVEGFDWPRDGLTMIGYRRLTNSEQCLKIILSEDISGDVIETGVWRGGSSLFMRAVLGEDNRRVWAADSYAGFHENDRDVIGAHEQYHGDYLKVSSERVHQNFERYGVSDRGVVYLEGWFQDTLPRLRDKHTWSLVRLDGDTYESTKLGLENLYPDLSEGGFLVVDDYGAVASCREAVNEYLAEHHLTPDIHQIDWTGVYWRKA